MSSECSRLVEAATEKLSVKVEEQNSEIRKLKAMIGEQLSLDGQQLCIYLNVKLLNRMGMMKQYQRYM